MQILANLRKVVASGVRVVIRIPVVLGEDKYAALGMSYRMKDFVAPTRDRGKAQLPYTVRTTDSAWS